MCQLLVAEIHGVLPAAGGEELTRTHKLSGEVDTCDDREPGDRDLAPAKWE